LIAMKKVKKKDNHWIQANPTEEASFQQPLTKNCHHQTANLPLLRLPLCIRRHNKFMKTSLDARRSNSDDNCQLQQQKRSDRRRRRRRSARATERKSCSWPPVGLTYYRIIEFDRWSVTFLAVVSAVRTVSEATDQRTKKLSTSQ
jgi:hypothetical protein